MTKAIFFDLDGTILDTVPDIQDSINRMLAENGLPPLSAEEIVRYVGNGAKKLVDRCLKGRVTEERAERCLHRYNEIYTNCGSPKTRIFPGLSKTLPLLKEKGYLLAVITNKPQETADEVKKIYLDPLGISYVFGQREGIPVKPDPKPMEIVLAQFGLKREEVVFVGDGETDAAFAINAGVRGISCLWGYREKELLLEVGAREFIDRPEELLSLF
ncbi:MAG: HAD-IA family hydrolase [Firmicutes bacterium]|nr:HAD-IA family hydrolase [Bacillota bacterium]